MCKKYIVTATPPTTNGGLHVGHISGPYMGADIFSRFQKMIGNEVTYVSGSDDHQTYVETTGERLNRSPEDLYETYHKGIKETLKTSAIEVDAFTQPKAGHDQYILDFVQTLMASGAVKKKKAKFWYCKDHQRYLFEAYVSGLCKNCLAGTCGAICEACGYPNDSYDILDPHCSVDATHSIESREVEAYFLELERFRDQFEAYYASKEGLWRPHILQLCRELLSRPLADYPISYPGQYGIPFPIPMETPSVVNVWGEMLPGLVYSTAVAMGITEADIEKVWQKDQEHRLVQFLGYDNSYFFAFAHLGMLFAAGEGWIRPEFIITNEFYLLDYRKFSTSQGHVVWADDILKSTPVDALRFFLCSSNPEFHQTNFSEPELQSFIQTQFLEPLTRLESGYNGLLETTKVSTAQLKYVDGPLKERIDWFRLEFEAAYSPEKYNLNHAARSISNLILSLNNYINSVQNPSSPTASETIMANLGYGILSFATFAHPIIPQVTEELFQHFDQSNKTWNHPNQVTSLSLLPLKLTLQNQATILK